MTTEQATKTATFVKDLEGWRGAAALYRMSPPHEGYEFVIASAVDLAFGEVGCETYLFGAHEDGQVADWGELDGSFKGEKDHATALSLAGYEVVRGVA